MAESVSSPPGVSILGTSNWNRIRVAATGALAIGVLLTYSYLAGVEGSTEDDIIVKLVEIEHATGSYQTIAGVTDNGTIFTKSGSIKIGGTLASPTCEINNDGTVSAGCAFGEGSGISQAGADARYLRKAGGTMTGFLALNVKNCNTLDTTSTGMIICGTDATGSASSNWSNTGSLRNYFNTKYLSLQGGTMTGFLALTQKPNCDTLDTTSTGQIICGTDANTQFSNTGSLEGYFDTVYAELAGATFAGAVVFEDIITLTYGNFDNNGCDFLGVTITSGELNCGEFNGISLNAFQNTSLADPDADRITFWDDSAGTFSHLRAGTGLTILTNAINVLTSSTSQAGIVELADSTETTAGTDTARAITPDGLAGSVYGERQLATLLMTSDTAVTAGSGTAGIPVPLTLSGWLITNVLAVVDDKGVTGTTNLTLRLKRAANQYPVTSVPISIGDEFFASDETINTTYDNVQGGDLLYWDIDRVHSGTAPNGLSVSISLQAP